MNMHVCNAAAVSSCYFWLDLMSCNFFFSEELFLFSTFSLFEEITMYLCHNFFLAYLLWCIRVMWHHKAGVCPPVHSSQAQNKDIKLFPVACVLICTENMKVSILPPLHDHQYVVFDHPTHTCRVVSECDAASRHCTDTPGGWMQLSVLVWQHTRDHLVIQILYKTTNLIWCRIREVGKLFSLPNQTMNNSINAHPCILKGYIMLCS